MPENIIGKEASCSYDEVAQCGLFEGFGGILEAAHGLDRASQEVSFCPVAIAVVCT